MFKKLPAGRSRRVTGRGRIRSKRRRGRRSRAKPSPGRSVSITFPVGSPWLADVINQVGVEFNKAKAKGLVEGTLQKYIQPSYATATPEQQIAAIQQMVRDGIDGILLLPLAGPPLAPAIDAAGKAGVPVVILDNVIDQAKYAVNVWSQNNSPAAAGVAGLVKNGQRAASCAASPATRSSRRSRTRPWPTSRRAQGSRSSATIYGKWTNATAKAETVKWLAVAPRHEDRRRDPERHHDGRHRAGVPADRPHRCRRSAAAAARAVICPGG